MFQILLIGVCLIAGVVIHHFSGKDDSPAEQMIEEVLNLEGVNVDFSADDKAASKAPVVAPNEASAPTVEK